jgi:hypothetical protein
VLREADGRCCAGGTRGGGDVTESGATVNDNSGAAFEAAIRRVAAVTDYRAFVDALGWLPADIELLDEAYAMFTFGLTTEDVVAVLKSGYAFAYVQGFRRLMDSPDMPIQDVIGMLPKAGHE